MGRRVPLLRPAGIVGGKGTPRKNSGGGNHQRRSGHQAGGDAQPTQAATPTATTPQRSQAGSTPQGSLNRSQSIFTGAALGSGGGSSGSGILQRRSFGRVTGNNNRQSGAGRSPLIGSKRQVRLLSAAIEPSPLCQGAHVVRHKTGASFDPNAVIPVLVVHILYPRVLTISIRNPCDLCHSTGLQSAVLLTAFKAVGISRHRLMSRSIMRSYEEQTHIHYNFDCLVCSHQSADQFYRKADAQPCVQIVS